MQSWEPIFAYLEENRANEIKIRKIFSFVQFIAAVFLSVLTISVMTAYMTVIIFSLPTSACYFVSAGILITLFFIHTRLYSLDDPFLQQASDSPFGMLEIFFRVILFGVPILFRSGFHNLKSIPKYKNADFESCARILDHLKDLDKGVPAEDLKEEFPFLDVDALLPDLLLVEGFLYIHDTDRFSLTESFKSKLSTLA